jgi:hypothetical protein
MEGRERKKARGFRQNANYYSREEDLDILRFIAENKRFDDVGGNELWQVMGEREVVEGRSWQSLKERFTKVISERIRSYGLSNEIVRGFGGSGERKNARGFRQNANYYSRDEDLKILNFIAENKRFDDVRGNEVWQSMEERKVVEGRSWQSMKERFRKVISDKLMTYGLSNETVRRFGGFGGNG